MSNFLNTLNNFVGIIGLIISFLTFYYFQNEKFYLFVQKIKTKLFKFSYSILWRGDFSLKSDIKDISQIKQILFNKLHMRDNYIETGKKDEYFKFKIKVYKNTYNETIILVSFKEGTYISSINNNIRTIKEVLKNILKETNSELVKTDIFLEFLHKNPYEGFFIKRVPFEKIKDFSVKIDFNEIKIEAKKDKIIIHSDEMDNIFYILEDLIALKVPLIKD